VNMVLAHYQAGLSICA